MTAPILIQVYTRKKHFINCIESLSKCKLANQTHLFIASDTAKTDADKKSIEEIRNYSANVTGFNKVDLIMPEENLGAVVMWKKAIAMVFSKYEKLIYSEDDNIFSPNFLEFINDGLEFFKDYPNVFSICGYKHPFQIPRNYNMDIYVYNLTAAWGFGIWKEKYLAVDFHPESFNISPRQKRLMPCSWNELMLDVVKNKKVYGDAIMGYHCLKKGMINIYPIISLVQNHGNDGSGIHCGISPKFSNQEICTEYKTFKFVDKIDILPGIEKRIANAIDYPFMNAPKRFFFKIIRNIKNILPDFVIKKYQYYKKRNENAQCIVRLSKKNWKW